MSIGVRVERKDNLVLTIPLITDNYTVNDLNSLQELFTEFADVCQTKTNPELIHNLIVAFETILEN